MKEEDVIKGERILKVLKRREMATGEIAILSSINFWGAKNLLEKLEKENKILARRQKNAIYWRVNKYDN